MKKLTPPSLFGSGLLLRPIIDDDIHNIFKGLSHPDIIKYYGVSFNSLEATQEQMDWYKELVLKESGIWFAICSLDNNNFLGAIGLSSLDKKSRKAELGFWLFPEFWGQGIMAKAVPILLHYGFNTLSLHRIEAFVETENQNCKTIMKKLEFQCEGTMIDCEIKDGKFISLEIYSKIKL